MIENNDFKNVINSSNFLNFDKSKLITPIGLDANSKIIYNDIQSMSPVFIGGITGSGKSTYLHTLITSLLARYTAEELKLVLVDFKMVEFSIYDQLPHLMMPICNDFMEAEKAIKTLIEEKEKRFELLKTYELKNIQEYNEYALNNSLTLLSPIVLIVDELDYFIGSEEPDEQERLELVKTLIKDAKEVGINIIISSQIPYYNFTDENFKDQFITKISFKLSYEEASIGVIGIPDAALLEGLGDMIYVDKAVYHFQGLYINQQEIKELIDILPLSDITNNLESDEKIELLAPIDEEVETEEEKQLKVAEKKRKLKKNYLKLLIQLIVTSVIYLIANSCDKFEGINSSMDVKNMIVLDYTKYVMYVTYVLTFIAIIIFVIKLYKKDFPKIKINFEKLYNVLDWILLLPLCISLATFCFTFIFTFTNVSGDSMNPNISEGDRLLVTYPSEYNRFDVVVIKVDSGYKNVRDNDLYLKRIIGLPGEYIDYVYENGTTQLYVNGKKVEEAFYTEAELRKYLTYNSSQSYEAFDWGEKCFTEGTNAPEKPCDKIDGHYIIPEGYYFVLGDNRLVSKDSRDIGLVKEEDIIGITKYVVNDIFKPIKID